MKGRENMKTIAKIFEYSGISLLMIGGCSMDSASIIIPLFMAFGGLAMAFAGWRLETEYV